MNRIDLIELAGTLAPLSYVDEWNKCIKNPCYFVKKYCGVTFKPWQKTFFKSYIEKNESLTIFPSERGAGYTTLLIHIILYRLIFGQGLSIGFASGHTENAQRSLHKVLQIHSTLPDWLINLSKAKIIKKNKLNFSVMFENDNTCNIYSQPHMLRGTLITDLLIDDNIDHKWGDQIFYQRSLGTQICVVDSNNNFGGLK